ncbi:MAG: hypothetical protein RIQ89_763 [Bacteroidota bacterium]|jgi:hypothetical protein
MKNCVFLFIVCLPLITRAERSACDSIVFNLDSGRVEFWKDTLRIASLKPADAPDSLIKKTSCAKWESVGSDFTYCGEMVKSDLFKLFWYRDKKAIDLLSDENVHTSLPLIGMAEDIMYQTLGDPKAINDMRRPDNDQTVSVYIYPTFYGFYGVWVDAQSHLVFKISMYLASEVNYDFCEDPAIDFAK